MQRPAPLLLLLPRLRLPKSSRRRRTTKRWRRSWARRPEARRLFYNTGYFRFCFSFVGVMHCKRKYLDLITNSQFGVLDKMLPWPTWNMGWMLPIFSHSFVLFTKVQKHLSAHIMNRRCPCSSAVVQTACRWKQRNFLGFLLIMDASFCPSSQTFISSLRLLV